VRVITLTLLNTILHFDVPTYLCVCVCVVLGGFWSYYNNHTRVHAYVFFFFLVVVVVFCFLLVFFVFVLFCLDTTWAVTLQNDAK
jgi:hypothetical protein